ncbi:FMN-dependent NADH-azoreductase [Pseudaestuariivita rosea]|uniref:FMN-dependent NADH-azoreductase n=1 Tax=Pseudaestuariivita rosea TaxID=2763263 RepID=UPI001ABB25DC|nr:NAD(P)H-dependent oxidoreductase [Pseudaestuariivita rosea]
MTQNILRIDASARTKSSVSRKLTDDIIGRFSADQITVRDLAETPLPHVDEQWVEANFTPADNRTGAQKQLLAQSDQLVSELQAADTIVIGLPIYNFGVPASMKAWIDLVARVGVTFQYSEQGPKGLLKGKRAIVAVTSGGTKVGSDIDFATGYLRHVLGFLGITDVTFVQADQLAISPEETIKEAEAQVQALAA